MTAHVLISGTLFREPEQRTSKAGKPFTTATLKAKDGETAQWWKVLAFSESVQAELMRLTDGDALSVQGGLKAETYEIDNGFAAALARHVQGSACFRGLLQDRRGIWP
jgi:single-stranded DNA-binding protein